MRTVKVAAALIFLAMVFATIFALQFTSTEHREKVICGHFRQLDVAIRSYVLDHGALPETLTELVSNQKRPYLDDLPRDPWGHKYGYFTSKADGKAVFILLSFGNDGELGGIGSGEDIPSFGSYCTQ